MNYNTLSEVISLRVSLDCSSQLVKQRIKQENTSYTI